MNSTPSLLEQLIKAGVPAALVAAVADLEAEVRLDRARRAKNANRMRTVRARAAQTRTCSTQEEERKVSPTPPLKKEEELPSYILQTSSSEYSLPVPSTGDMFTEQESGLPAKQVKEEKASKVKRIDYSEAFEAFWRPYPRTPVMSKAEAWAAWQKLGPEDRDRATEAVPKYVDWLRSKPDHLVIHACRFITKRRFDGLCPAPEVAEPAEKWASVDCYGRPLTAETIAELERFYRERENGLDQGTESH